MRRVAKLSSVGPDVQNAFVEIWTRSKVLALRVGEPRTLARALRVLLPKCHCEKTVKLYRGEAVNRSRVHGFSWTSDPAIAEAYARNYKALEGGSVVLETIALPVAVI